MDGVKNSTIHIFNNLVKAENLKISLHDTPRDNLSPNSKAVYKCLFNSSTAT